MENKTDYINDLKRYQKKPASITSYIKSKDHEKWLSENNNFIYSFNSTMKMIMLILYFNKRIHNISKHSSNFQLTFSLLNKYLNLFEHAGLVEKTMVGRDSAYKITEKGELFCQVMLHEFD